jgi:phenylpropionate dioxygenase-like ring-hydroxylating dioxygenase large terminal subunit
MPFAQWAAPLVRRYSDIMTANLRFVHRESTVVACNWKVVTEAFLETYHLNTVHRRSAAPYLNSRQTAVELYADGHSTNYVARKQKVSGESARNRESFHPAGIAEIPDLLPFYRSAPPAPSIFPNVMMPLSNAGFPIITFWPLSLRSTRIETAHFGTDWRPRPTGWDDKIAAFRRLVDEDVQNWSPCSFRSIRQRTWVSRSATRSGEYGT